MMKQEFSNNCKKIKWKFQQKGEYEKSRGKRDCKGMAWTVVKQALFGMSVFQVVTKGQQQQQGYFSL